MNRRHNALVALLIWLGLGLLLGLAEWPYQLLSELGFVLQRRLWLQAQAPHWLAAALVFVGTFAMLWLAWGPLARGRGGGLTPVLALQGSPSEVSMPNPALERLELGVQLRRLPLIALTHVAGLTVGVESPSAALGASLLLAVRRRWPQVQAWAVLPIPLLAAIGGGAGLGAAFRSPLLGVAYAIEELSREKGLSLVLPTLLLAGSGAVVATTLGQPARLAGLNLGLLDSAVWPWALLITVLGAGLGALFVRLLIPLAHGLAARLRTQRIRAALLVAALLTLLAWISGGLSLNDGSLSLAAALKGDGGGSLSTLLWRFLASLLSIAAGAPGGLMHDTMTLGALLASPLTELPAEARAQLLVPLLLASAISAALAEPWRGSTWNEAQLAASS